MPRCHRTATRGPSPRLAVDQTLDALSARLDEHILRGRNQNAEHHVVGRPLRVSSEKCLVETLAERLLAALNLALDHRFDLLVLGRLRLGLQLRPNTVGRECIRQNRSPLEKKKNYESLWDS